MMKTWMMHRNLALLGLLAVAACDQVGTGLFNDDLTPDEVLELTVLEDEGSYDIPVEITTVGTDVAASFGASRVPEGRSLTADAQRHFASARAALRAGDRPRALEEAREARRLIARAVLATGGQEALDALIERIEEIALTADDDDEVFDSPRDMADELKLLADAARDLLARGDSVGAGERALLGEQRARYRRGRRDNRGDIHPDRARLAVELAGTAVSLAERLIDNQDVPPRDAVTDVADRQNRWLMHAQRLLERAEQALANGRFARAVHFAQHAHWSALKAVILPGGITEAELDAMVVVAENLYEEAEAALGDNPTELELRLFERAGRLIELGKAKLGEGNKRGVAPLWRASVICAWLLP